jgi:hypothetical protein
MCVMLKYVMYGVYIMFWGLRLIYIQPMIFALFVFPKKVGMNK